MKRLILAAMMLGFAGAAQAHEVWVERDGNGPVRIYLGEPGDALPEGGDPEFARLKAPRLVSHPAASLVRKAGYLEATVAAGDVRVLDDNVFEPWDAEGKKEGVVYYARAGRSEPRAALPFEIVPIEAGSNRFTVMRDGKAVPGAKVVVITPDKWSKTFVADGRGGLDIPIRENGRYLLSATIKDTTPTALPGGKVDAVHHITTTTFVK
ncbi:hypothetical protein FHS95_001828 [Sphingomonas naasensis]|uniref:DUF4198 domain-containing protein n=1 Tax=Sphingomonas naasensis TaxID=1344951 RepID=A0A4S1WLY4_9SPHN|nr:DUF4198 domain-containing protein [Sphingomonas naasensis]NIJ20136.1 hypothetical protein [Sphingomonas naasensis]TGX44288.1 DUF4198 domain-containing protein [Sphingomonas naasensis]